MSEYRVTPEAMRPASDELRCFYCHEAVGGMHKDDCVLIMKLVKVRLTLEYEVPFPAHWTAHDVEFQRNDGSWCAGNLVGELARLSADNEGCLCNSAHYEYIGEASDPYLSER